jgi:hypothetical protein
MTREDMRALGSDDMGSKQSMRRYCDAIKEKFM